MNPYAALLSSIIYKALKDNDKEFLKSGVCKYYFHLLGIDYKYGMKQYLNSNKDTSYPEYFLENINYKKCGKCNKIKYVSHFRTVTDRDARRFKQYKCLACCKKGL